MLYCCLAWKLRNKRDKMMFMNASIIYFRSIYGHLKKYKYSCFAYIYRSSQVDSRLNGLLYYFIVIKDGSGFFE